ncbi:hypothetical protein [Streptomyces sp. NPDC058657]|uniref:hypothetical protein n=1 Tax=unclassified Streptomyces TaxID=2593676 RepID=UPI003654F412
MRKPVSVPAIVVAAALTVAAPATAFATDVSPARGAHALALPADPSDPASPSDDASDAATATVRLVLSEPSQDTGFRPGEEVTLTATTNAPAQGVKVSSDAFGTVQLAGSGTTWSGTATIADDVKIGTYDVTSTADFGDTGAQSTATLTTWNDSKPTPTPTPPPSPVGTPTFTMSTDGGKPGDKVGLKIKGTGELKDGVYVQSDAFGGKVTLSPVRGVNGAWHGTATVAKNTKAGYYAVTGYAGDQKVDTLKFGVAAGDAGVHNNTVKPLHPNEHRIPRGSVQTGTAPAAHDSGADIALVGGLGALGVASVAVVTVIRRRSHG